MNNEINNNYYNVRENNNIENDLNKKNNTCKYLALFLGGAVIGSSLTFVALNYFNNDVFKENVPSITLDENGEMAKSYTFKGLKGEIIDISDYKIESSDAEYNYALKGFYYIKTLSGGNYLYGNQDSDTNEIIIHRVTPNMELISEVKLFDMENKYMDEIYEISNGELLFIIGDVEQEKNTYYYNKYDKNGKMIFSKKVESSGFPELHYDEIFDNFILINELDGKNTITKYNSDWKELFKYELDDVYYMGGIVSDDENIVFTSLNSDSSDDIVIIKLDNNGNKIYKKSLGNELSNIKQMIKTSDGGLLIQSEIYTENENSTLFIKTNKDGDIEWKTEENGVSSYDSKIKEIEDGYIIYNTIIYYADEDDLISTEVPTVIKIDKKGKKVWSKQFGNTPIDKIADFYVEKVRLLDDKVVMECVDDEIVPDVKFSVDYNGNVEKIK